MREFPMLPDDPLLRAIAVAAGATVSTAAFLLLRAIIDVSSSRLIRTIAGLVSLVPIVIVIVTIGHAVVARRWILLVLTVLQCLFVIASIRHVSVAYLGIGFGLIFLVGTLGILGKAWFWSEIQENAGDRSKSMSVVSPVRLPANTTVYVALGDSFSAGEGVEPYTEATRDPLRDAAGELIGGGNRCHRSQYAFPLALQFEVEPERRFRACSGAVTRDLYDRQVSAGVFVDPQIGRDILGRDVGLVTITIGGNDLGFASILRHCLLHVRCMDDEFDDMFDDGQRSGRTLREWVDGRLTQLERELTTLYAQIADEAPNARIVVVVYPYLFPTGFWRDTTSADCIALMLLEVGSLLDLQQRFNEVLYAAANHAGVEIVDPFEFFEGHEACGPLATRFMQFPSFAFDERTADAGSMHPTANGHLALARTIECYLFLRPTPADSYPEEDDIRECARNGRRPN